MADTKISALPAVVTPDDADEFAVNQAGTSKKETRAQIRSGLSATGHTHVEADITDLVHDAVSLRGGSLDETVATPSDGNILVWRTAGSDWVLEAKPAGAVSALDDLTDVVITAPADNELLAFDTTSGNWINQTQAEAGFGALAALAQVDSAQIVNGSVDLAHLSADARRNNVTDGTAETNLDYATYGNSVIRFDDNIQIDHDWAVGGWALLHNIGAADHTVTPEAGATINGSSSAITVQSNDSVFIRCETNAGDAAGFFATGALGLVDLGGQILHGNFTNQITDADARTVTDADTGSTLFYTGAGHTWTFNNAGLTAGAHGVIRNNGLGAITVVTDGVEKFHGTEPIPAGASATWEWDGTNLWLDVNE